MHRATCSSCCLLLLTVIDISLLFHDVHSSPSASEVWPSHYTKSHQELHRTLRSTTHSHLDEFEVVIPSMVDEQLNHLSHNVRHLRSNRIKRDTTDDVIRSEEIGLRYQLVGFGEDFNMHLKPNHRLLAPNFNVRRMKRRDGMEQPSLAEEEQGSEKLGCHYHGKLASHRGGLAAISTCEGLTGLLRTKEDDILMEPVHAHVNHTFPSPQHPHVIYKRRHLQRDRKHRLHYCGKKRQHPVAIPKTPGPKKLKLLSNGEIELEEDELLDGLSRSNRRRRSTGHQNRRGLGDSLNGISGQLANNERRSASDKNVETLVVADRDMILNHQRDHRDITTYVLTVMNMVSGLFSDRTLDGQVNVVLVGLMLMEENEELTLKHKADVSLNNFCLWQSGLNYSDGRRPDHSILLTGIDICVNKNSPCETLGLAQIGGMCSYRDSCTINEDMGLGLAFTVAHESGHSFGMKHDGQGNFCDKKDGHIMSPTLNGLNGVFTWSACSRESLSNFLTSAVSSCLDDHPAPVSNLDFPDQLPGEIYNANSQCKWQFGVEATTCAFRYHRSKTSICKVLWCQRSGRTTCETKYMPAAEGTLCGDAMWCRSGTCVPFGSAGPDAVDGGWGEYGQWSSCTRTCGGGVHYRERSCNNPKPKYGGRHCDGDSKIYRMCNTEDCPPTQIDFRSQQCAEFNKKPYRRQYFTWVPFTKYSSFSRGKCELLCKAENYDFFDILADQVIDGTPCDASSSDVCIQGKCQHVGCDFVLGSNATHDECGVCNGDNSTCQTITGSFDDVVTDSGYYEVVRIPRGARSVKIWEERCCTHSYIAAKSGENRDKYFLNGAWRIDHSGERKFGGAKWIYERKAFMKETLSSVGPLDESIVIEVLIVARNPGISYSYTLPIIDNRIPGRRNGKPAKVHLHRFDWAVTYGSCSKTCGGGVQAPVTTCMRDGLIAVRDSECEPTPQPQVDDRQCNPENCPARWEPEAWGDCSRTCGGGLQTRQVACKMLSVSGDAFVVDSKCHAIRKLPTTKSCNQNSCPPQWKTGIWSKCSRECGRGVRTRSVSCRSGFRTLQNHRCNQSQKPKRRARCLVAYCQRKYQWFITGWNQCSVTCGNGLQHRELKCSYKRRNGEYRPVSVRRCRRSTRPAISLQKACSLTACPSIQPLASARRPSKVRTHNPILLGRSAIRSTRRTARWITGTWQKCSVSCGGGFQKRAVRCLQSGRPSNACVRHRKPVTQRSCNTYRCSVGDTTKKPKECNDNFKWCYLVPQHGQCSHKYFGQQCCQTCHSNKKVR